MSFTHGVPGVLPEEWPGVDAVDAVFVSRVIAAAQRLRREHPAVRSLTVRSLPLVLEAFGVVMGAGSRLFGEVDGVPVHLCVDSSVGPGGVAVCANVPGVPQIWVFSTPGLSDPQYEVFAQLRADGVPRRQALDAVHLLFPDGADV